MFNVQMFADGQWQSIYSFNDQAKAIRKVLRMRQAGLRARVW